MELTDYLAKVPYLTEIPLRENTQELDHSGETGRGAFPEYAKVQVDKLARRCIYG